MKSFHFIEQEGRRVLLLDFSEMEEVRSVLMAIGEATAFIEQQPKTKSLLVLTDITNTRFDNQVVDAANIFVSHNEPYVLASALVGLTGLKLAFYKVVQAATRRHLPGFPNRAAALAWLVQQGRHPALLRGPQPPVQHA